MLIVGGAAAFVISLGVEGRRIENRIGGMARVTLPEGGVVELSQAGEQTIFYEGSPHGGPRLAYTEIEPSLVVTPRSDQRESRAAPLEVRAVEQVEAYPRGAVNGLSIARFDAPTAGRYRIDGRLLPSDTEHPDAVLAIGQLRLQQMMGRWDGVFGGAVAATLGLVCGTLTLILTFLVRRRQFTTRDD
jgi:hypothetical protein